MDTLAPTATPLPLEIAHVAEPRRSMLDLLERLAVLSLYLWLAYRFAVAFLATGKPWALFLLVSEGLVVVFLLIRRPTRAISQRPTDWLLATVATCAPLLVGPSIGVALLPPVVAATVMLIGLTLQVHAKLTLGRSFGCVAAHRGLQLGGPYRFVRHPMYLGYLISHIGFLAITFSVWNVALYALGYAFQVPRLLAEERLLAQDPGYQNYQRTVRYRLIPGLF